MPPNPPSETLPRNLRLGGSNRAGSVGVDEAAPGLAVLELGRLGRAHAHAARVGAAPGRAVGVVDAPARDELGARALAHVPGPGVVGGDLAEGDGGDFGRGEEWSGQTEE